MAPIVLYCNSIAKYCNTLVLQNPKVLQNIKVLQNLLQNFQVMQKILQDMKVLQKLLQKYSSIANSIVKYESIVKSIAKCCVAEICNWQSLMDQIISIRYLFDSNLCLLYNLFDEYNDAILKYYLKISIDQCMMWCFFVVCPDMG